jgi:hypothetical protein
MQPNACAIRKVKDDITEKGGNGEPHSKPQRDERLPPEILEILKPALQVGSLSGMFGAYFLDTPLHQGPYLAVSSSDRTFT